MKVGQELERDILLESLIDSLYNRNDVELKAGKFRVRGDVVDIFPAYANQPIRIEFWGDEVEAIREIDPISGETLQTLKITEFILQISMSPQRINWAEHVKQLNQNWKNELNGLKEKLFYWKLNVSECELNMIWRCCVKLDSVTGLKIILATFLKGNQDKDPGVLLIFSQMIFCSL